MKAQQKRGIKISIILLFFTILLILYFALPALNVHSYGLWLSIILLLWFAYWLFRTTKVIPYSFHKFLFRGLLLGTLLLVLIYTLFLPVRIPQEYYNRLSVEQISFEADLPETILSEIPKIDKRTSRILGDKNLPITQGKFTTQKEYTLVLQNGTPYRISPLQYTSWFHSNAPIPGFIKVNTLDPNDSSYVEVPGGIQYSPYAYGTKNLKRYLRIQYPSAILGNAVFEIDDQNTPYWVVPEITIEKGIGGRDVMCVKTVTATYTVNATTGEVNRYNLGTQPAWVSYGVDPEIILDEIKSYGYFDDQSIFTFLQQRKEKMSYSDYTYTIFDQTLYLITLMQINDPNEQFGKGFMLVNMRTGKAKYATSQDPICKQTSAIVGLQDPNQPVKNTSKQFTSIPVPCKLNGNPTYLTYIGDTNGILQYALSPVSNTTEHITATYEEGLEIAITRYQSLKTTPIHNDVTTKNTIVDQITSVRLDDSPELTYTIKAQGITYTASSTLSKKLSKILPGDAVKITSKKINNSYEIIDIEKKSNLIK